MRADLGALFQHDDIEVFVDLFETDRGAEARWPRPHDHHVEFHCFPFWRVGHA